MTIDLEQVAINAMGISIISLKGRITANNKLNPKLTNRFLNILIIVVIKSTHRIRYR